MKKIIIIGVLYSLVACVPKESVWTFSEVLSLDSIAPIGVVMKNDTLIVSDGDNGRLVFMTPDGLFLHQKKGFNRPMHIDKSLTGLWVPNYATDEILMLENKEVKKMEVPFELDSPAGVASYKDEIGIADFYHHRVLFFNGEKWSSIGQKGVEEGEFHYPTDLYISQDRIYVADAYNHRVQVFDKSLDFLFEFGKEEKMNASTGLTVSENQVLVTDFENNRVLVYALDGKLLQILTDTFEKPIDLIVDKEQLYVVNYKGKSITKFKK